MSINLLKLISRFTKNYEFNNGIFLTTATKIYRDVCFLRTYFAQITFYSKTNTGLYGTCKKYHLRPGRRFAYS